MDFFKPRNLYRASDRLRQDWRVLRIDDPQDLTLFARREELHIGGIVYRYPVTNEMRDAASEWAQAARTYTQPIDDGITRGQLKAEFAPSVSDTYISTNPEPEDMRQNLLVNYFPAPLHQPVIDVTDAWKKIQAGRDRSWSVTAHLRLNSNHHPDWERHHSAATLLLSGERGTRMKNSARWRYETSLDDLLLFDNLEHCAPPVKQGQLDRINYVFSLN
jgi:hypothetical protein